MKYFLTLMIGCLFLHIGCKSSSKSATSNAQQANVQHANVESNTMTQDPVQPEISSAGPTSKSDIKGSAESHYITFSGIKDVMITDGQGNNNGAISTAYRKNVPGVSEMVIGAESIQIMTPINNSYTMRFTGTIMEHSGCYGRQRRKSI